MEEPFRRREAVDSSQQLHISVGNALLRRHNIFYDIPQKRTNSGLLSQSFSSFFSPQNRILYVRVSGTIRNGLKRKDYFTNVVQCTTAIVYNPVWWVFVWGLHFLSLFSVILVGTVL